MNERRTGEQAKEVLVRRLLRRVGAEFVEGLAEQRQHAAHRREIARAEGSDFHFGLTGESRCGCP